MRTISWRKWMRGYRVKERNDLRCIFRPQLPQVWSCNVWADIWSICSDLCKSAPAKPIASALPPFPFTNTHQYTQTPVTFSSEKGMTWSQLIYLPVLLPQIGITWMLATKASSWHTSSPLCFPFCVPALTRCLKGWSYKNSPSRRSSVISHRKKCMSDCP